MIRRQIVENVKRLYWAARGAQEIRDVLKATVENFQSVVDYHSAQFSIGAIPEQDLLRIQLESERLKIDANLAVVEATRDRVELQKEMGQTDFPELILTEPLDSNKTPIPPLNIQLALAQRVEVRVANAALEEAQAKAKLEDVSARPVVFCGPDGAPLNPDVLRRDVLSPALDRLRILRVKGASGFHAFRHTAGSVVEARTGRLKLAQRLLRHSNISTTADIYTHVTKQGEREAAIALEGAYDLFPVVPNLGTGNKKEAVN